MNRSVLLLAASLICFVIAFLLAIDAVTGGNLAAWEAAGFGLFVAAHLP